MVTINIKCSSATKLEVEVDDTQTTLVSQFKELIAEKLSDTPASSQRLIFAGRILKDSDTLASYNIVEGSTVHMVKSAAKTPSAQAARGAAITDDSVVSEEQQRPEQQQQQQQPRQAPVDLGGLGGLGGMGGLGDMASMFGGGGMGGGMPQMSPEMMDQMYSNPMVQQMMAQLSSNPDLLRSMIESNPMIQQQLTPQMREMLANPEFLRMATNPDVMRATAQMQAAMRGMQGGGAGFGAGAGAGFGAGAGAGAAGGLYNPWAQGAGANAASSPPSMPAFNPFAGMMGQPPAAAAAANQAPPEERFQQQLQQLNDMGFWNAAQNIRALSITGGNVEAAIEYLLSNPN
ncbi:hypothetical protein GGI19_000204 [Coemansia pectinata]|uniref:Ubiquilin n=1 Tax=Coemansia pectinata TaxID=1052879 RepID=A0A9W8H0N3_9FUNG|nr:hypothetical protein GGI19_000204 [Coemansia pectinata]